MRGHTGKGGQQGQALIGAMVVMLLVFALAGSVAIGASRLMAQQTDGHDSIKDDLAAQSAVAVAVARVAAGRASNCVGSALAASSARQLGDVDRAACRATTAVSASPLRVLDIGWTQSRAGPQSQDQDCSVTQLASDPLSSRIWVVFTARWSSTGLAYVDDTSTRSCLPPAQSDRVACSASAGPSQGQPSIAQLAMECDLDRLKSSPRKFLHIKGSQRSPSRALYGDRDESAGGTLYLLAVPTGVRSPDFEEVALFVSGDGRSRQLRYEAPLP